MDNQNSGRTPEDLSPFELAKASARQFAQGKPLLELVEKMREYGALKDEAEENLKTINAWYDVFRMEVIPEKMEAEGITNVKYDGIGRVSVTADLLVSIKGGSKDELYKWLNDNNLGDIIQPTINSSTLKAFVKGRMKAGKDYPADSLNVTPISRASITKV